MYFVILKNIFSYQNESHLDSNRVSHFNSRQLTKWDTIKIYIFQKGDWFIVILIHNCIPLQNILEWNSEYFLDFYKLHHFYVKMLCHFTYHCDSGIKCHCSVTARDAMPTYMTSHICGLFFLKRHSLQNLTVLICKLSQFNTHPCSVAILSWVEQRSSMIHNNCKALLVWFISIE